MHRRITMAACHLRLRSIPHLIIFLSFPYHALASFVELSSGQCSVYVNSQIECSQAATDLGKKYESSISLLEAPPGCFSSSVQINNLPTPNPPTPNPPTNPTNPDDSEPIDQVISDPEDHHAALPRRRMSEMPLSSKARGIRELRTNEYVYYNTFASDNDCGSFNYYCLCEVVAPPPTFFPTPHPSPDPTSFPTPRPSPQPTSFPTPNPFPWTVSLTRGQPASNPTKRKETKGNDAEK